MANRGICRAALLFTVAIALAATTTRAQSAADSAAPAGPGLRIDIDPRTGTTLEAPPPARPSNQRGAPTADLRTSSAGLVEQSGPTAAHGVSVDLAGRFRSAMRLEMRPTGDAVTQCETTSSTAAARP
jgi:hypothetical protein